MHSKNFNILSFQGEKWEQASICVIAEKPITLTVNSEQWLTLMCTPSDLEALAVGFLYNEEIIETLEDIASVRVCPTSDTVDVWLNHSVQKPTIWARTSGCSGGTTSREKDRSHTLTRRTHNGLVLSTEKIYELVRQLNDAQELYRKTGGVHTSAISDAEKIFLVAEDIGRHNTLDKLAGRLLLEKINTAKMILLTTGRISHEMIQKSGRMGATVVISRTSPTSLSVQMAENMGITLVGYARGNRFTVYTHPERILSIAVGEKLSMR